MTTAVMGVFGVDNYGNEASLAALLGAYADHGRLQDVVVVCERPDRVTAEHRVAAAPLWSGGRGLVGKVRDVGHLVALSWGMDAVVVPGTGVLEGVWIQAGGLPLALFVVAATMWLRRRPMLLLSVGVDTAGSTATRRLFAGVLRLASVVTVRDERSALAAAAAGRRVEVRPDLAFRISPPPPPAAPGPVVAVGVMDYAGPHIAPSGAARDAYERSLDALVATLRAKGQEVLLIVGAAPDLAVAGRVEERAVALPGPAVRLSRARSYPGLVDELAAVRVTIASRYHNLLASLAAGTPVVGLGYGAKHAALADEFGLPADFTIAAFDPAAVAAEALALAADPAVRPRIAARLASLRGPLEAQVRLALEASGPRPRHSHAVAGQVAS